MLPRMDEIDRLTPPEMLTFAGLARKIIRDDGRFTDAERDALSRVAQRVAEVSPDALLDTGAVTAIGEKQLYERIEKAAELYPNEELLRSASLEVTRPEARAAIHALLFDVATADVINAHEGDLLAWLAEKWDLDEPTELAGEATDAG